MDYQAKSSEEGPLGARLSPQNQSILNSFQDLNFTNATGREADQSSDDQALTWFYFKVGQRWSISHTDNPCP